MGIGKKFKDIMGIEEIYDDDYEDEFEDDEPRKKAESRGAFSRGAAPASRNTGQMRMVIIEPQSFDDCTGLVDSLKARKPIIVNLEKLDQETAKKIFSFLNGATYALNGNVQGITEYIFVFAPENVDISASADKKDFEFVKPNEDRR